MTKNVIFGLSVFATVALPLLSWSQTRPTHTRKAIAPKLDFSRDVRPILSDKCFACHGPDEKHVQANLRLDSRAAALAKGQSGKAAIVPGKSNASAFVERILATGGAQMPPASTGKPLTEAQKRILIQWVEQGAVYKEHWSFVKPVSPPIPAVQSAQASTHPIDAFIQARLSKDGLKLQSEADKYTLIRRVSLDLVGLPPTPADIEEFATKRTRKSYELYVDKLLASPRFGERWARPWLDLARFADSAGYGSDPLRPNLWPWREWVINALNANMPYDQFTIEQLAGDLLPNATGSQILATAFHRNTMTNTEGGTDDEEFRTNAVKDRAATTAQVWMGLTMGCAQCHSHKFDPIKNNEYYRFMAFFNQTEDNDQPDDRPNLPFWTPELKSRQAALQSEVKALEASAASDSEAKKNLDAKKKELAAVQPIQVPVMKELPGDKQRVCTMLVLGNFMQKGDVVTAGTPIYFPPMPKDLPMNRLGLANWIVSRDNPLTARVAVNRYWAQLFGKGLVLTEEDFGHQGTAPSHPELLDWLAVNFMDSDWNVKKLLKTIVMSATYRQSSKESPALLAKDPNDVLLGRYPRRRLDAEGVRDQALALSGLLSGKIGGPSVYPPQPDGMWKAAFNGDRTWPTSTGEDRYRRGLYTFWRRTVPYPSMATFDAPSREICTVRRIPTNTPLQALVTLNDPAYLEMAQAFGRRIVKEGGATVENRAAYAVGLATCRPATQEQTKAIVDLYSRELARFQADSTAANKLATEPLGKLPEGLNAAEAAAWTVVGNVLLNLDSVMTKG
jgi:hypothetical protein